MPPDVWITLDEIAAELDATVDDVETVMYVELSTDDYDDEVGAVSPRGRQQLVTHFRGGADPEQEATA